MSAVAASVPAPRPARMSRRRLALVLGGTFAAIVAIVVLLAALLAPAAPKGPCPSDRPCGEPPRADRLVTGTVWRSSELGFALEFSGERWRVRDESPRGVQLAARDGNMELSIVGVPAAQDTPRELFDARRRQVEERVLGLAEDTEPAHELLAPVVGLHPAVGDAFRGTVDTPQGTSAPVGVVIMAAGNRRVSVVAVVATTAISEGDRGRLMHRADSVLNTLRLPGDGAPV